MLKKIRLLFLGLIVAVGSACVTPTHASSAVSEQSIILTHIQAGGSNGAKEELIALYNSGSESINITDWCLENKANVKFVCVVPPNDTTDIYLLPYSHALFASEEFAAKSMKPAQYFAGVFKVTNQSSGSLTGSADTVRVVSEDGKQQSVHQWATALPGGKALLRATSLQNEQLVYVNNGTAEDWSVGIVEVIPESFLEEREREIIDTPEPPSELHISELLPNAAGSDEGREFIELVNQSTSRSVKLDEYSLRIGTSLDKTYTFTQGDELKPGEVRAFYNSEIKFSLNNTSGKAQLYKASSAIGESISYEAPSDGVAWANFEAGWAYTKQPTPGAANIFVASLPEENEAKAVTPCAPTQYRSPETGRCRLIASVKTVAACSSGQERNIETGRCRKIAETKAPTPCKEGQERNPDTNRCRNSLKMTQATHKLGGISKEGSKGLQWYSWLGIGAGVVGVLGYVIWEWRVEIRRGCRKAREFIMHKP